MRQYAFPLLSSHYASRVASTCLRTCHSGPKRPSDRQPAWDRTALQTVRSLEFTHHFGEVPEFLSNMSSRLSTAKSSEHNAAAALARATLLLGRPSVVAERSADTKVSTEVIFEEAQARP